MPQNNQRQSEGTRSRPVVIGAGPAGLTAACALAKDGFSPLVLEAGNGAGGISRTVTFDGYRYDLGGHRFYSKNQEIERLWDELADEPLLVRPRLSRIFYENKFYDYPLKLGNAFRNLGPIESTAVVGSYLRARLRRSPPDASFADWVSHRFGRRLYSMFFESYTEKVWGRPCDEISAEWAAQRIRNFSLARAVGHAVRGGRRSDVTTLAEEFRYPRLGPGQLWSAAADKALSGGGEVRYGERVVSLACEGSDRSPRVSAVVTRTAAGEERRYASDWVVSSMPLRDLVAALPDVPAEPLSIGRKLGYRGFIAVAVVVDADGLFPDNWVYVHSGAVRLARVQNEGNWSPALVPEPGRSCLCMEYFADPGDELWTRPDEELVDLAFREVRQIGLVRRGRLLFGDVTRVPDAYPAYQRDQARFVRPLRDWLRRFENLACIGRNGQHRYNNMDHSMMTGLLAAANHADGGDRDVWAVNAEAEYHEEVVT